MAHQLMNREGVQYRLNCIFEMVLFQSSYISEDLPGGVFFESPENRIRSKERSKLFNFTILLGSIGHNIYLNETTSVDFAHNFIDPRTTDRQAQCRAAAENAACKHFKQSVYDYLRQYNC